MSNQNLLLVVQIALLESSSSAFAGTMFTTYVDQDLVGGESVLASIDTSTGTVTEIGLTGIRRIGALTYDSRRGKLFGVGEDSNGDDVLVSLNPSTGVGSIIGYLGQGVNGSGGLTYDTAHDLLFSTSLVTTGGGFGQLLTLDPVTGEATPFGPQQPEAPTSFAYYPPSGQLLFTSGFEEFGAPFGTWDPVTGVQTTIGPTATIFGMDYDPDVDMLFGINGSFGQPGLGDKLFTIDPFTGQATLAVTLSRAEFYSSLAVIPIPSPPVAFALAPLALIAARPRRCVIDRSVGPGLGTR